MPVFNGRRLVAPFTLIAVLTVSTVAGRKRRAAVSPGKLWTNRARLVPSAAIVVTNAATNAAGRTTSNRTGYFEVNFLDPGNYIVS